MAFWRERVGICRRQFLSEGFVAALVVIATGLNLLTTSYAQEGFQSIDCDYLGGHYGDGRNFPWAADYGMTGNSQQPALYPNEGDVTYISIRPVVGARFISSVELRLLYATVYSYTTIYSYNGSQMQHLALLNRYDLAAKNSTPSVRLPRDELDRIQKIISKLPMTVSVCYLKASDTIISIQSPDDTTRADLYHVPRKVMQDSRLMNNVLTNISSFSTDDEGYGAGYYEPQAAVLFPLYTDYLYLTPAERFFSVIYARYLISSELRNLPIKVVMNGVPSPVLNFYHQATIQATPDFLLWPNSSAIEMSFGHSLSGEWSPHSPIINTLEGYGQYDFNYTKTHSSDGVGWPVLSVDLIANLTLCRLSLVDSTSTVTFPRFPDDKFDRLWNVPYETVLKAPSYDFSSSDAVMYTQSLPDSSTRADVYCVLDEVMHDGWLSIDSVAIHMLKSNAQFIGSSLTDYDNDYFVGFAGAIDDRMWKKTLDETIPQVPSYLIRASLIHAPVPVELLSLLSLQSLDVLHMHSHSTMNSPNRSPVQYFQPGPGKKTKKRRRGCGKMIEKIRRRHLGVLDVSDSEPEGNQRSKSYVLIISICSASIGLLLCCATYVTLRKLCKQVQTPRDIQQALADRQVHPLLYQYGDLKLATRDFHEDRKLGQGAFGAVYKGVLADETKLAVKKLLNSKRLQVLDDFLNEVVLITGIKHRNLILLKGCCVNYKHRILVYEYAENGNLAQALWGSKRHGGLNWEQRFNICVGVARGLSYLHEELQPSIVHRDIKPENILLDGNFKPKIADFGLARHYSSETSQAYYTTRIVGTLGYFAPEHISEGQISDKGDVYSYGIVVLEIVSGRKCIDHSLPSAEIYLKDWVRKLHQMGLLFDVLQPELRGSCVVAEVIRAIKIALLCVQYNPDMRPSMSQIVTLFSGNLDIDAFLNEPISPDVQDIMVTLDSDLEHPALDGTVEEDCATFFLRSPDSQSSSGDANNGRAGSRSQIELSTIYGRGDSSPSNHDCNQV